MTRPAARAVTFDFGQTLAELDNAMLSRRLAERDVAVTAEALVGATVPAWRAYNDAVRAGLGGHPWKILMDTLLKVAGVGEGRPALVDWLWNEQPRANLWRKPIAGMIDIVRELRAQGVPVAVVSNSEGRLAELIDEMGWSREFDAVADSGRLGVEKPDRAIFAWAASRIETPLDACVHVGDAWAADFLGALGAGMRAVLFRGAHSIPAGDVRAADDDVALCDEAHELRGVLRRWSLPLSDATDRADRA